MLYDNTIQYTSNILLVYVIYDNTIQYTSNIYVI